MPDLTQITGTGGDLSTDGATAGGIDPISAISGAISSIFGTFTQIGQTKQTQIQTQGALLLASQPKPREETADKTPLIVAGALIFVLVVILVIPKRK